MPAVPRALCAWLFAVSRVPAAFGVASSDAHKSGLVLIQHSADVLSFDATKASAEAENEENDQSNVTRTKPRMFTVASVSENVRKMDAKLKADAEQRSAHLAALVQGLQKKVGQKRGVIAAIRNKNEAIKHTIHERRAKNEDLRKQLNATRALIKDMSEDVRSVAVGLGSDSDALDALLAADVESVLPAVPTSPLSLLQVADSPSTQIQQIETALEDVHKSLEENITGAFIQQFGELIAREQNLTTKQRELNATQAEEEVQGSALELELQRLQSLLAGLGKRNETLHRFADNISGFVHAAKNESDKHMQVAASPNATVQGMNASDAPKAPKETTKSEPTSGFMSRLVKASKRVMHMVLGDTPGESVSDVSRKAANIVEEKHNATLAPVKPSQSMAEKPVNASAAQVKAKSKPKAKAGKKN